MKYPKTDQSGADQKVLTIGEHYMEGLIDGGTSKIKPLVIDNARRVGKQ